MAPGTNVTAPNSAWLMNTILAMVGCAGASFPPAFPPSCRHRLPFATQPYSLRTDGLTDVIAPSRRWGILPVFGKIGSDTGLTPGLAVAIQKVAELVYVLGTVVGGCARPCFHSAPLV